MASFSPHPFPRLQETVIDGRLESPFFRREQLYRLHQNLLQNQDAIIDGIIKDSGNQKEEAFAELYLTLSDVKLFHDDLDPKRELEAEYRIAHKQNNLEARLPIGIAVIQAQKHTAVYSIIAPISSAIAAGNCVVVVAEQTLHYLPSLVSDILLQSLDPDIIELTSSVPKQEAKNLIHVDQTGSTDQGLSHRLRSPTSSFSVAMVDRSADLGEAAKSILRACTSFGGKSPYAPDLILVNEFAKKDFLRHLLQQCAESFAADGPESPQRSEITAKAAAIRDSKGQQIVMSGRNGSIVDITDRSALESLKKASGKTIRLRSYSSLEDAIETANHLQSDKLLSVFAFGDFASCKYLLQFIEASVAFANLVPPEILVGPAAPEDEATSLSPRYPSSLFSVPYPKFSTQSGLSSQISTLLASDISATARADLWKQVAVHDRESVKKIMDYFERGVLVGASTTLLTAILSIGGIGYFTVRQLGISRPF